MFGYAAQLKDSDGALGISGVRPEPGRRLSRPGMPELILRESGWGELDHYLQARSRTPICS